MTAESPGHETEKVGLPPVSRGDARLLILGSLPGDASLAAGRYYAHPTNAFWRLLGNAVGEDLAALPYDARLRRIVERRIALWDVIAGANRRGSLDAEIRAVRHNALADFLLGHGAIDLIAFNGATASREGRKALVGYQRPLRLIDLPSSSAAHTMAFADKAERWAVLGDVVQSVD